MKVDIIFVSNPGKIVTLEIDETDVIDSIWYDQSGHVYFHLDGESTDPVEYTISDILNMKITTHVG